MPTNPVEPADPNRIDPYSEADSLCPGRAPGQMNRVVATHGDLVRKSHWTKDG